MIKSQNDLFSIPNHVTIDCWEGKQSRWTQTTPCPKGTHTASCPRKKWQRCHFPRSARTRGGTEAKQEVLLRLQKGDRRKQEKWAWWQPSSEVTRQFLQCVGQQECLQGQLRKRTFSYRKETKNTKQLSSPKKPWCFPKLINIAIHFWITVLKSHGSQLRSDQFQLDNSDFWWSTFL